MKSIVPTLTVLCLCAPLTSAGTSMEATFSTPAQIDGVQAINWTGVLVVVGHNTTGTTMINSTHSIALVNHTRLEGRLIGIDPSVLRTTELPPRREWSAPRGQLEGHNLEQINSVVVQDGVFRLATPMASGVIMAPVELCLSDIMHDDWLRVRPARQNPCLDQAIGWRLGGESPISMQVSGQAQHVEVGGASISCSPHPCQATASWWSASGASPDEAPGIGQRSFYSVQASHGVEFSYAGQAQAVYILSVSASSWSDRWLRLPGFLGPHADPAGNQSLVVDGAARLADMERAGDHRVHATVEIAGQARLDEGLLPAAETALAAAIGVGLATLAVKIALGLLTMPRAADALAHPKRRTLQDYIEANPGATFRELVRETGIPSGTARHHVSVLKRANLIAEHPHRETLRYFENHGRFDDSWNTVVLLRDPDLKAIHAWLLANPGANQKEILAWAAGEQAWSRSTTQHRLSRLVNEGLVTMRPCGRYKTYAARHRAPTPALPN